MDYYVLAAPFFSAYSQSDLFGKLIFWGLFFLSALSWVVLLHKLWLTKKVRLLCQKFDQAFEKRKDQLLSSNLDYSGALQHPYFNLYKIVKATTLEVLDKNRFFASSQGNDTKNVYLSLSDVGLVQSHVEAEVAHQTKSLEKNLFILSMVVTLAPFMGLLGTVWGILLTFANLQTHTLATSNSAVLSGLSMALATTVLGLIVAIPALVAYNFLKHSIKDFTGDMENFSHRLLTTIELQYRNVDVE